MADFDRAAPRIHQPEEMRKIDAGRADYRFILGEGAAEITGGYHNLAVPPIVGDTMVISAVFTQGAYEVISLHEENDPQQDDRKVIIVSLRWLDYV